ncbi:unnamed protein product [Cunninghamella blakesleeana]
MEDSFSSVTCAISFLSYTGSKYFMITCGFFRLYGFEIISFYNLLKMSIVRFMIVESLLSA